MDRSRTDISAPIATNGPIRVRPNPARAGQDVEIEYDGSPPLLYKAPSDPDWKTVPIDPKTGKGRIRVPHGTPILVFSNSKPPYVSGEVFVVDTAR